MSSSNCCFLTCIQISQEAGQVVWHSHLLKNVPWFVVIHTVKGFGWRNKIGRPLSPPQIHQKSIWMLSNFHKTTTEHWQRTPGTQKGSPFSSKGGKTKYKTKWEAKELGTETCPGKGVVKEKFPNSRKPSHQRVCGEFWNLRGQHNWEENTHTHTHNTSLTTIPRGEVAQTLRSVTSEQVWTGRHGLYA